MSSRTFIFAGGGTGGHLFPGIAVARELARIDPAARVCFLTTARPLDAELLAETPFERIPQTVRPMPRRPWGWPGFLYHWRRAVVRARRVIRETRAAAVLGLGGYAAGPAVVSARKLGVPTAILNPDAIPGRANRRLARCADLIVLQWDWSRRCFGADAPTRTLGCPIRAEFADAEWTPAAARARFGLDVARRTLLVTGASQGARTINQAMALLWPQFARGHPDWQLLHLTGGADAGPVAAAYRDAGAAARVLAFTHEMPAALAAADLVVSRAGASTLAELTAMGRPSVLLPYPFHRDRHQEANARILAEAGAARVLTDRRDPRANADALRPVLEGLARDEAALAGMQRAARAMGRPDAARAVAEWLLSR